MGSRMKERERERDQNVHVHCIIFPLPSLSPLFPLSIRRYNQVSTSTCIPVYSLTDYGRARGFGVIPFTVQYRPNWSGSTLKYLLIRNRKLLKVWEGRRERGEEGREREEKRCLFNHLSFFLSPSEEDEDELAAEREDEFGDVEKSIGEVTLRHRQRVRSVSPSRTRNTARNVVMSKSARMRIRACTTLPGASEGVLPPDSKPVTSYEALHHLAKRVSIINNCSVCLCVCVH